MTFAESKRVRDSGSGGGDLPRLAASRFSRAVPFAMMATAILLAWCLAGTASATTPRASGALRAAVPSITIVAPYSRGNYGLAARVRARYSCTEDGSKEHISTCSGTVPNGEPIDTSIAGNENFTVTATDTSGNAVTKTVHYTIIDYTNPLVAVRRLGQGRIDQGVDYAGSGPILALGTGTVIKASNHDPGWPGHGWLLYRLLQGRFAGRYVYVAENITVHVRTGQTVTAGEKIATLHDAYPDMETGWASDIRDTTLANADGHLCPCGDPGGWSTIEGRNFNNLLRIVGAPSGYLQPRHPKQHMPPGWPKLYAHRPLAPIPQSRTRQPEGWTARAR